MTPTAVTYSGEHRSDGRRTLLLLLYPVYPTSTSGSLIISTVLGKKPAESKVWNLQCSKINRLGSRTRNSIFRNVLFSHIKYIRRLLKASFDSDRFTRRTLFFIDPSARHKLNFPNFANFRLDQIFASTVELFRVYTVFRIPRKRRPGEKKYVRANDHI